MSNSLLGFAAEQHAPPRDEEDQRERSSKKIKGPNSASVVLEEGGEGLKEGSITHKTDARVSRSYKETVSGVLTGVDSSENEGRKAGTEGVMEEDGGILVEGHIEEQKVGEIDCPIFSFSVNEEQRIQQPWKQGVIVQLLGRKIGYKALENRLKQLWVRRGVIQIVDLSHDFYLVTFTSLEDQCRALTEGPWMIYDHYLVVRPWSSNFDPASTTVTKTAVWVRFSGLPIEYYDSRILHFIGNRIGKTVKVDKNTLLQERGKYARLCVEVDLSKPLLAMFELKGRHYKVEYEGLHLLCLSCGRFDHYLGGCSNKPKPVSDGGGVGSRVGGGGEKEGDTVEEPWTVVQKPRRPRKGKDLATVHQSGEGQHQPGTQAEPVNTGSRFALLSADATRDSEISEKNNAVTNEEVDNYIQTLSHNDRIEKQTEKPTNERKKGNNNSNKTQKINATRANFKEKKGNNHGKKSDKLAELMVSKELDTLIATHANPVNKNVNGGKGIDGSKQVNSTVPALENIRQDPVWMATIGDLTNANYHRDPGIHESKFFNGPMFGDKRPAPEDSLSTHPKNTGGRSAEVEVFVDAKDNGDSSIEEWDMEEEVEGANQDQMKNKDGSSLC
ncbi:hypothetical protein L195_g010191 [Trifolium pratense]|uniref:DUF4283 domain-containing protein n=1 Tax=Trifolium pratense TaxID=57577 RepID=A0A2K3PE68_TRIPR|nr:hypothetical protein L195_g010191 [Trifolium pratense]